MQRIRDIHSSEKVFWRKILDIYATSIDYDSSTETSQELFNKSLLAKDFVEKQIHEYNKKLKELTFKNSNNMRLA